MFTDLILSQREGNILYQVQFYFEVEVRWILAVPPRTGPAYDRQAISIISYGASFALYDIILLRMLSAR